MAETPATGPGVPIPPPAVYLGYFLAGLLIDRRVPAPFLPQIVQYVVGGLVVAASVVIAAISILAFRRAKTAFNVYKPATALVTDGVFRYSRHPGYLAATLLYVGAALLVDSGWILGLVLLPIHWTDRKAIRREEAHLAAQFGDDFRRYKQAVRRWI